MVDNSEYNILYYSEFNERFKKALKIANHSLDNDFNTLLTVVTGKLPLVHEDPRKLPNHSDIIPGLGAGIEYPIVKIRMHVKQFRELTGRVIFLFDKTNKNIFFIDIYLKKSIKNHDPELIKKAYQEYLEIVSKS